MWLKLVDAGAETRLWHTCVGVQSELIDRQLSQLREQNAALEEKLCARQQAVELEAHVSDLDYDYATQLENMLRADMQE